MEQPEAPEDIVHPEVRAHINSLVSALGGPSADDDARYQLGDDALEVLRDMKRWIRFYDEKTNRMDVARCLQQANVVEGDLLPILATWSENTRDGKFKSRIALACFEVMVPLTWPMDRDKELMTVNHHRHLPVLQLAQVAYKRAIINFDGARILHTAVRTALPSMAIPIGDRTARDQGIIKLVLYFLRNIAMIVPPPSVKYDGDESQISRSATIDAFSYQDIFIVLLTLASNMGEEFRTEDLAVMEIIYHLVKRVDIEKLFMNEQQLSSAKAGELSAMMNKESAMLQSYNRKGATRHSRFGAMVWVKREGGKLASVSGADGFADASTRNQIMDNTKQFRPTRRARRQDKEEKDLGLPVKLNARANNQLRSFVEDFLDSGFNPLFTHVRKTIDREAEYYLHHHRRQFFYLVAWFLEAERARRKSNKGSRKGTADEVSSFNLVAGVLTQEMFITLTRALHESYDGKDWIELTAVMRCYTQILLTVQEMTESPNEDDQEIAENVLSRLFYEEATHDVIAAIIRTYKAQNFDYLDAATELIHHFLRILEAYSKQNVDMQVRSRKRARRKKNEAKPSAGADDDMDDENDNSGDDEAAAERSSKERKFDFHRFSARFTHQGVVNTFVKFTKFYRELNDSQLKRAHRYFYRVAFKQQVIAMLYRVDIIHLFHRMVKGPEALEKSSSMYKDWEELTKQILRKCFKKIEDRPELIVEMLFSKMPKVIFFLEYGYEQQTIERKSHAKPAAELVFKRTEERDRQIAIAVGALLDKNQADNIAWVKGILAAAESDRTAWAAADEAMAGAMAITTEPAEGEEEPNTSVEAKQAPPFDAVIEPDNQERRTAMLKNSYLRLLMKLSDFEMLGTPSEEDLESAWVIPGHVTAEQLKDTLHYINQAEFSPPTFDEGVTAEDQLKRKVAARKRVNYDDDDEEDIDDEALFEPGGPTAMKIIDEDRQQKKPRKRRRKASSGNELEDSDMDERARKRREREREKARKVKSAMYVKDGDDDFDSDEDEQFFARERAIATQAAMAAKSAVPASILSTAPSKTRPARIVVDDDEDEDEDDDEANLVRRMLSSQEEPADASDTDDTPVDAESGSEGRKRRRVARSAGDDEADDQLDMDVNPEMEMDEAPAKGVPADDDEDGPVLVKRPRVRGGFVVDSDDDE
ncbi:hypothetical protein S40293_00802 [Stachybotrys chartarum IBT 40293]|nr:hypothetical protein S40293_00802 [Stachybotrys chartarum IBT 40293]